MRLTKTIEVGDQAVHVKEITVAELRQWWAEVQAGAGGGDAVDGALFADLSLTDLARMTSLTSEVIDTLAPSEIRLVIDACREVNPDFFAMQERLANIGRSLLSGISSASSAPSSSAAITMPGATP